MLQLEPFEPRLVGAVLAGTVTVTSGVELHVFADAPELVAAQLEHERTAVRDCQRRYRLERRRRFRGRAFASSATGSEIEVFVLPERSAHQPPLSPVDQKPMRRAARGAVLALARYLALADRDVVAPVAADVDLARPADPRFRVGVHLEPVRDPAGRARDREHHGEHRGRNPQRLVDDARIEIDVRIELALDEVLVLERDLFELHRDVEQRMSLRAELRRAPCGTSRG